MLQVQVQLCVTVWFTVKMRLLYNLVFLVVRQVIPAPVVSEFSNDISPESPESCVLPKRLGLAGEDLGRRTFLEDCPGLGECKARDYILHSISPERFNKLPKPLTSIDHLFGVHPVICCPEPLPTSSICFESDAFCADYVERNFSSLYEESYDYGEYDQEYSEYGEYYGGESEAYYDPDYSTPEYQTVTTRASQTSTTAGNIFLVIQRGLQPL